MWQIWAIAASLSLGSMALIQKLAATFKPAASIWELLIFQGIAILLIGFGGFFFTNQTFTQKEIPAFSWALLAGFLLAFGSLAILLAFKSGGDASKVQPIVNTNTLVAVFLALIILGEYQNLHTFADWAKLIGGTLAILGGSFLILL